MTLFDERSLTTLELPMHLKNVILYLKFMLKLILVVVSYFLFALFAFLFFFVAERCNLHNGRVQILFGGFFPFTSNPWDFFRHYLLPTLDIITRNFPKLSNSSSFPKYFNFLPENFQNSWYIT